MTALGSSSDASCGPPGACSLHGALSWARTSAPSGLAISLLIAPGTYQLKIDVDATWASTEVRLRAESRAVLTPLDASSYLIKLTSKGLRSDSACPTIHPHTAPTGTDRFPLVVPQTRRLRCPRQHCPRCR